MELLLKERIRSLWEQILSFKRSSYFEKGRNWRELLLVPVVSPWCAYSGYAIGSGLIWDFVVWFKHSKSYIDNERRPTQPHSRHGHTYNILRSAFQYKNVSPSLKIFRWLRFYGYFLKKLCESQDLIIQASCALGVVGCKFMCEHAVWSCQRV